MLSYQDVLHRKMLKLLQQGRPKDCAEAGVGHGIGPGVAANIF